MAARRNEDNDLPKVKPTKENLRKASRIFRYLKPYRGKYILGLIFLGLTAATAIAFPMLLSKLINASGVSPVGSGAMDAIQSSKISTDELLNNINIYGIYMLALFIAQAVFSFFRVMLFVNVTEDMLADIRKASYSRLVQMPMTFFSSRRVGELTSRLSADISQLQDTFTTTIAEFLRQFIIIIGGIVALAWFSPQLCLVMMGTIPILAVITIIFGRFIRRTAKQVQDKIAESSTIVEETMQGIASVKAFANEAYEILRYNKTTNGVASLAKKGGMYRGAFASFIIVGLFGGIVFIIWWATTLLAKGELKVGEMIGFMFITIMVGASFGGIAELYAQIQKALGSTERIMDLLEEKPEPLDTSYSSADEKLKLKGEIAFSEVRFNYPSRPEAEILQGLSFKVRTGEKIAIVGPSGAGKSTIIQLLMRFYNPNAGFIAFDGKDALDYPLTALRNNIAIVPQDVLLFGGSIKENIAYGKPGATDEEIIEAAKKANAHSFVTGFTEGYETIVGDRGTQLSGGQRQRIAIARAVLKNPAILLLDEATSSLDSESEKLVQEALDKLMLGRTSVIIAHRLSTIRDADRILVVDKGRIVESGSHEELIRNTEGIYYNLSKLQFELTDSSSKKEFLES
jgi:ABC-type multidrug transport system fused ATPase/permease subunit